MVAIQHLLKEIVFQNAPSRHAIPASTTPTIPCDWANSSRPMGHRVAIVLQENQRVPMVDQ